MPILPLTATRAERSFLLCQTAGYLAAVKPAGLVCYIPANRTTRNLPQPADCAVPYRAFQFSFACNTQFSSYFHHWTDVACPLLTTPCPEKRLHALLPPPMNTIWFQPHGGGTATLRLQLLTGFLLRWFNVYCCALPTLTAGWFPMPFGFPGYTRLRSGWILLIGYLPDLTTCLPPHRACPTCLPYRFARSLTTCTAPLVPLRYSPLHATLRTDLYPLTFAALVGCYCLRCCYPPTRGCPLYLTFTLLPAHLYRCGFPIALHHVAPRARLVGGLLLLRGHIGSLGTWFNVTPITLCGTLPTLRLYIPCHSCFPTQFTTMAAFPQTLLGHARDYLPVLCLPCYCVLLLCCLPPFITVPFPIPCIWFLPFPFPSPARAYCEWEEGQGQGQVPSGTICA